MKKIKYKNFQTHKASLIKVDGKKVLVDLKIQPLVKWFNKIPGCVTLSSCEGEDKPGGGRGWVDCPYVSFLSTNKALKYILNEFSKRGRGDDTYSLFINTSFFNPLRYHLYFNCRGDMLRMTKRLLSKKTRKIKK